MKCLIYVLSIAAGLTMAGCGPDESGHIHDDGSGHTHAGETTPHAADGQAEAAHRHESGEEHSDDTPESVGTAHMHAESEEGHSHSGGSTHSHDGEKHDGDLGPGETFDEVRRGVRLTLSYDSQTGTFNGSAKNTTQELLPRVSVGVQLSNGTELGPTAPVDLDAGESQPVELDASGETFESWNARSELGSGGHTHGEEGDH